MAQRLLSGRDRSSRCSRHPMQCAFDFITRRQRIACKRNTVMLIRCTLVCSAVLGVVAFQGTPAHALSMHECSAKYQAAKTAGTLNGMKWNEFRKTQCGAEATAAPTTAAAPAPLPAPPAHAL